jgi:hypothetical protein
MMRFRGSGRGMKKRRASTVNRFGMLVGIYHF